MPLSSVIGAQSIVKPGVCTSSTKPASPYDGQVIYMTDADQTAVWDGSSWVGIERSRDRNVIINGAMQVAQRGTSTASITTTGIYTADRWDFPVSSFGTWTQSVENDAPTGSGFRKSLKWLCTTANASPGAATLAIVRQRLEGQNVQQFAKGTASAKQFALSFWVKSNVTGTYIAELYDFDNTRQVSASYTISASATWEKKTIIFPADTTSVFDNDNAASLDVHFWLGGGSNVTSGTLNTAWATPTSANRAVGQTNLASATNNYWQITGVQLEAGAVATPFEFEDYGTTLRKCYRYYQRFIPNTNYGLYGFGTAPNSAAVYANMNYLTPLRTSPSALEYLNISAQDTQNAPIAISSMSIHQSTTNNCSLLAVVSGATQYRPYAIGSNNTTNSYIGVSAEL
jgi:hypothetical protein